MIKDRLYKIYAMMGMIVGTLFLLIIPAFCVPDESLHFREAYHVSNTVMGIKDSTHGELSMREVDAALDAGHLEEYDKDSFEKYMRSIVSDVFTENTSIIRSYSADCGDDYLYIVSAIGITIGRCFRLGSIQTFLLGRFLNLLFFVFCMTYAVKKTTVGKMAFFGIGMLPVVMQQAASYSYDVMVNGMSVIVVAVTIALLDENSGHDIKTIDYFIYSLAVGFLIPTKGYAYMLFLLLPIWVLLRKKNRELVYVTGGAIFINLAVLIVHRLIGNSGPSISLWEPHILTWCGQEGYCMETFLKHPMLIFSVFYHTLIISFPRNVFQLFGRSMGAMNILVPRRFVVLWMVFLFLAFLKRKSERTLFTGKDKIFFLFIVILTVSFIYAGMLFGWTPLESSYIMGVQGRYFVPVLPMSFLLLRTNRVEVDEKFDLYLCFVMLILNSIIVAFIYVSHS